MELMVQKKMESVEYLGKILVDQEREFTMILKKQSKVMTQIGITTSLKKNDSESSKYELQSLLNESSSDDEDQQQEEDTDDDDNQESLGEGEDLFIEIDHQNRKQEEEMKVIEKGDERVLK
jgi:hypothetical protein